MAYAGRMSAATRQREKLADALVAAGPDAPTLCEGWSTHDLAAHIVLRDRRPDAALGMLVSPLAGHLDNVTKAYRGEAFDSLVGKVRSGAPYSPLRLAPLDNAVNTLEFAVHSEDVRRGVDGWEPLPRDPDLEKAITSRLKLMRSLLTKKSPVSLALRSGDGFAAGPEEAKVTVTGDPLELLLFAFGRQAAARVTYVGSESDVEAVKTASFGV